MQNFPLEKRTCLIQTADGTKIPLAYELERKRVKNINLRICPNGTVFVSASPRVSLSRIEDFIASKNDFILKAIKKLSEKQKWEIAGKRYLTGENFYLLGRQLRLEVRKSAKNQIDEDGVFLNLDCKNPDDFALKKRLVSKFFKQKCEEVFTELVEKIYPTFKKYNVPFPKIKIRGMTSRWGSCIPSKRQITLNSMLIYFSPRCIESVIVHEFCHFRYLNHSKDFYDFMTVILPDWKEHKRELEETVLL